MKLDKIKSKLISYSVVLLVFGCGTKENNPSAKQDLSEAPKQKIEFKNSFAGHLYIVGPSIDDLGNLTLDCDCCASHFYFCDDSNFIEVCYCLEEDSILTGKYIVTEDGIKFLYNDKELLIQTEIDAAIDSTKDATVYVERSIQSTKGEIYWRKYSDRFYITSIKEYAEEQDSSMNTYLQWLKNDPKIYKFVKSNMKSIKL